MGKLEYLDALKRAMLGLAPEIQARTLAYYDQRFVDGLAAGRSEQDVAHELGELDKIALTLRTNTHTAAFVQQKNPASGLRVAVSALGLAIFNLFMVVPAMVYAALLTALFACALGFYVSGIAITASGLAGANELVLGGPLRHVTISDDGTAESTQTRVTIGASGIHIYQDKVPMDEDEVSEPPGEPGAGAAEPSGMMRGAEAMAGHGIHIITDMDTGSRTTQTLFGLGLVVAGIVLFLLGLVVSKYTFIGIKRYVQMNLSLLRGS